MMIKQVLEFQKLDYGEPKDEELEECIKVQKENPDKAVILHYYVRWSGNPSGNYQVVFLNNDGSIRETLSEVKENMPKPYAM